MTTPPTPPTIRAAMVKKKRAGRLGPDGMFSEDRAEAIQLYRASDVLTLNEAQILALGGDLTVRRPTLRLIQGGKFVKKGRP